MKERERRRERRRPWRAKEMKERVRDRKIIRQREMTRKTTPWCCGCICWGLQYYVPFRKLVFPFKFSKLLSIFFWDHAERNLSILISWEKLPTKCRKMRNSTFTPLIFSVTGGCGKESNTVLKKLATMISEKPGNTQ